MKTKFILVALGVMLATVGCSSNTPGTTETKSTSAESTTTPITPKTRSEKVKEAASNLSEVFSASANSAVSLDTTMVFTFTNVNISKPNAFEITDMSGILSICSYKVEVDQEMKLGIATMMTSGTLKLFLGESEMSFPLAGFGFNTYLINSSICLDLSNPYMVAIITSLIPVIYPEITPEQAPYVLDMIIGSAHKARLVPVQLPLRREMSEVIENKKVEIDEWYKTCDFSILDKEEYSFIDSGFSFTKRQSGAIETTLSIGKSGFYAMAIAGATSDEELIQITKDFEKIEKVNTSIGVKTDANKRLTYVSTYLDIDVKGEDAIKIEGTIQLDIKYDVVGVTLPKSFSDYVTINLESIGNIIESAI